MGAGADGGAGQEGGVQGAAATAAGGCADGASTTGAADSDTNVMLGARKARKAKMIHHSDTRGDPGTPPCGKESQECCHLW
jgi:hypothetical protein